MTVGGTRDPRDGWYYSRMAIGTLFATGSMEGGGIGNVSESEADHCEVAKRGVYIRTIRQS